MTEAEKPSLYRRLLATGCVVDSHESDLYVPVTPDTRAVVDAFVAEGGNVKPETFVSPIDGKTWFDLPFQFDPFWAGKARTASAATEDVAAPRP